MNDTFPNVATTNQILMTCLEFLDRKMPPPEVLGRFSGSEMEFIRRFRTIRLGLGANANTQFLTTLMPEDGLVIIDGNRVPEQGTVARNIKTISNGQKSCILAADLKRISYTDKVKRVVLFNEQDGTDLDSFFYWVSSQPHDDTVEVIIFH